MSGCKITAASLYLDLRRLGRSVKNSDTINLEANVTNKLIDILKGDHLLDDNEIELVKKKLSGILAESGESSKISADLANKAVDKAIKGVRIPLAGEDFKSNMSEKNALQLFTPENSIFNDGILSLSFLSNTDAVDTEQKLDMEQEIERDDMVDAQVANLSDQQSEQNIGKSSMQLGMEENDRLNSLQLDKERTVLEEKRKGAKGLTWSKIVSNLFPGSSEMAGDMMKQFRHDVLNSAILRNDGTPVLNNEVPAELQKLKDTYKKEHEASARHMGRMQGLKWGELQDFLTNCESTEKEAYKAFIAYTVFDILLNEKRNFNGIVSLDEFGKYNLDQVKGNGIVRTDWDDSSAISMFDAMNQVTTLVLTNTAQQTQLKHNTGGQEKITFQEESTLPNLSKNSVAFLADQHKINSVEPRLDDVVDFVQTLASNLGQEPRIQAVFNRYFNPEPYLVTDIHGEATERKSLYAVYKDGLDINPETGAITQTPQSKIAQDMVTEFTSTMLQTEKFNWLNMTVNGKLDVKDGTHVTGGMLYAALDNFSENFNHAMNSGMIQIVGKKKFGIRIMGNQNTYFSYDEKTQKWKSDKPLTNNEYDRIFNQFGLGFKSGFSKNYIDMVEDVDKVTGEKKSQHIDDLIGRIVRISYANNLNVPKDTHTRFDEFGLDKATFDKNAVRVDNKSTYPTYMLLSELPIVVGVLNNMMDVDNTMSDIDSNGNKKLSLGKSFPLLRVSRDIVSMISTLGRSKDATKLGETLKIWRNHFTNISNGFVTGGLTLKNFALKNKVGTESHVDLGDAGSMHLNMDMYFQGAHQDSFKSSFFDFFTPSDKKKYPVAHVGMDKGIMPLKGGSLDSKALTEDYFNKVAKTVNNYEFDFYASWNAELLLMNEKKGTLSTEDAATLEKAKASLIDRFKTEKSYSDSQISKLMSDDDDPLREELVAMEKEKMSKGYSPEEAQTNIREKIESMGLTGKDLRDSGLINNRDYMVNGKGRDTDPAMLNEGLLEYFKMHSTQESSDKGLIDHLQKFVGELEDMGITKLNKESTKIISNRFESDKKPADRLWAEGALKVNGKINPGLASYFFQWNTVSQSLMFLNQGMVFDYDAKVKDKTDPRSIMAASFTSQIKRNVSMVSDFHQPILHGANEFGTPVSEGGNPIDRNGKPISTRGLIEKVDVASFDDENLDVSLLSNGQTKGQEIYDGAIFINPLELLKYQHSFGDQFTPLKSQILKNIITNRNERRGSNQFIKMASHQITSEMALNSRNNGAVDMYEMTRKMMDRPFDQKVRIQYTSKTDPTTVVNGDFGSMWEIFQALGKPGSGGRIDGFYNENAWKDLLEIEFQYPQVANKYTAYLIINSSVKNGRRKRNPSLIELSNDKDAKLVTSKLSYRNMGIQLNPDHDYEHTDSAISAPTQLFSAAVNEGRSQREVTAILQAVVAVSEHRMRKLHTLYNGNIKQAVHDELLSNAHKEDAFDGKLEMYSDSSWDMNDPLIDREFSSKLSTLLEKTAIRLKMNGGQMVITPVSNMHMLYELPNPKKGGNNPENITLNRQGYEEYILKNKEFADTHKLTVDSTAAEIKSAGFDVRNLKWNNYSLGADSKVVNETGESMAGKNITETSEYKNLQRLYADDKSSPEYKDALATYNQMLNDTASDIQPMSGEVMMPSTMRRQYRLREGDDVGTILADNKFFFNRFKEHLVEKGKLGSKADGTPESLDTMYKNPAKTERVYNSFLKKHGDFSKSLEGILPRIPTSGKQSANSFKIAGFMNSLSNAVGIPIEAMVVKGEDLDIDKGFAMMRSQDNQGYIFDYYNMLGVKKDGTPEIGKNVTGGRPLTKDEVKQYLPKEFLRMENKYRGTKDDWYEKGLENLMVDNFIQIFQSSKNAVEANTPVTVDNVGAFKKGLNDFSIYKPSSNVLMSTVNKTGQAMVGVMAASLKAASAITRSFQERITQGRLLDSVNGAPNKHIKTGITIDGKPYNRIANVSSIGLFDNLYDPKNENRESRERAKNVLISQGVFTEDQWNSIDAQMDVVRDLQRKSILEEHSWANYSELVNAAADNAKELILSDINANTITGSDISTMILLGVPLMKIFDIFTSPFVVGKVAQMKSENLSYALSSYLRSDDSKVTGDGAKYINIFKGLDPISNEFRLVGGLTKINQGIPNNAYNLAKYRGKIDKYLSDNNIKTSLFDFVYKSDADQDNIIRQLGKSKGTQLNILQVIKDNPHYMQFIKVASFASRLRNESIFTYQMVDDMLKDAKKVNFDEDLYNSLHSAVHSNIIFKYLKGLGKITLFDRVHSFSTPSSISAFVKFMNDKLPDIKLQNPDNGLVQGLQIDTKKHQMSDVPMKYISSNNFRKANDDNRLIMRGGVSQLDTDTKKALYLYGQIMRTTNMYTDNYSGAFGLDMNRDLNGIRTDFASKYKSKYSTTTDERMKLYRAVMSLDDSQFESMPFASVAHPQLHTDENIGKLKQKFIDQVMVPKFESRDEGDDSLQGIDDDNGYISDEQIEDSLPAPDSSEPLSKTFKIKTFDPVARKTIYMEVYVKGTPGDEKSVDWNTRFKVLNNDYPLLGAPYLEGVVSRKEFGTYYEGAEGDEGNFMGEDQANYGEPDFYVSKDISTDNKTNSTIGIDGNNQLVTKC